MATLALSKSAARNLTGLFRRFAAEDCGASLPVVAVILVPLLGIMGLATDASRGYMVKARIGEALDATALAAAHEVNTMTTEELVDYAQMLFDANFPPGYMGANVTLSAPDIDPDGETVTITASANVDATFMSLFGYQGMEVVGVTEVKRQTVSMDVAIAIDMSGSMDESDDDGGTRIQAARGAANEMIDILFGPDETKELLKIGLVPWNSKVNVIENGNPNNAGGVTTETVPGFTNPLDGGSTLYYSDRTETVPFLSDPSASSGPWWAKKKWRGCVRARHIDDAADDNDADHLLGPVETDDGTEWLGWEPIIEHASGFNANPCLSHGITRMTSTKSVITDAIDDLTNPKGATNIAQGLAWAWRVVTPGEPFDDAEAFPSGFHQRAIVLLTDGEQTSNSSDSYGGELDASELDDRLRALAENIKAQGIKIYAIQYAHESGPLADLMKDVASEPGAPFYHFAPNASALEEVFQEIADDLSELRITR